MTPPKKRPGRPAMDESDKAKKENISLSPTARKMLDEAKKLTGQAKSTFAEQAIREKYLRTLTEIEAQETIERRLGIKPSGPASPNKQSKKIKQPPKMQVLDTQSETNHKTKKA